MRPLILLLALATLPACERAPAPGPGAPPAPVTTSPRRLEAKVPLPELARNVLLNEMAEHGQHMENLLWATVQLDHEAVRDQADRIARAPKLTKVAAESAGLVNTQVPARFFELQDSMRQAAGDLRDAAAAKDDRRMAKAYARLSGECLVCHAVFMRPPAPPPEP